LIQAGHEVSRFERFSDDIEGFSLARKAAVPANVVWNPASARALRRVLATTRPDVVHLHNLFPLLSPSVLLACRREHVPVVITIHNYRQLCASGDLFRAGQICTDCVGHLPSPAIRHGCYRGSPLATIPLAVASVTQRRGWQTLASAYIFLSESQQRVFSPFHLPSTRCFVKPNLVPAPTVARTTAEPLVAYIGRLNEAKGLPLLMRAWERFLARRDQPGVRLVIAGSGPLENDVRGWAIQHGSVEVVGLLPREDCAALLGRARAAIIPSEWLETFGLVAVEAMAAGTAPIAPAHGSFPSLIHNGVDGVLFQPGNAEELAEILHRLADSPVEFEQLGQAARQTYERDFDPGANVARLEQIYRFAIRNPVWLKSGDLDTGDHLARIAEKSPDPAGSVSLEFDP